MKQDTKILICPLYFLTNTIIHIKLDAKNKTITQTFWYQIDFICKIWYFGPLASKTTNLVFNDYTCKLPYFENRDYIQRKGVLDWIFMILYINTCRHITAVGFIANWFNMAKPNKNQIKSQKVSKFESTAVFQYPYHKYFKKPV